MSNLEIPAHLRPFAMSFPAASNSDHWGDRVVTQGHADYCELAGHATHTIDGRDQGYCPRCGRVESQAAQLEAIEAEAALSFPVENNDGEIVARFRDAADANAFIVATCDGDGFATRFHPLATTPESVIESLRQTIHAAR